MGRPSLPTLAKFTDPGSADHIILNIGRDQPGTAFKVAPMTRPVIPPY
jgi:hypothetical protein